MELLVAPLIVLLIFWKKLSADEWIALTVYALYAISLITLVSLPKHSKIGPLFIGLPSLLILAYIYSDFTDHNPKLIKATSMIMFIVIVLLLLYFQLVVY